MLTVVKDHYHKTSISEYPQGSWNEGFELKVTYHNQLFDTIQLDLYDNGTFFIDKHIGRAEIRLNNLEGMPEIFTSYYEVLEKKLSLGATSQVSRKALMTSGVGAIQAEIAYQYRYPSKSQQQQQQQLGEEQRSMSFDFSTMNWLVDQQKKALLSKSMDNIDISHTSENQRLSDLELIEEFNRHLKSQRKTDNIQFKKFEQRDHNEKDDGVDYPDDSSVDDEEKLGLTSENTTKRVSLTYPISRANSLKRPESIASTNDHTKGGILETVSSFFGYTSNESINNPSVATSVRSCQPKTPDINKETLQGSQLLANTDDDTLKSFPILDTIGSWTMAKETNQVFRAIGKLLVAFVSNTIIVQKCILTQLYTRVKGLNCLIYRYYLGSM
jgi:hypothetical protein